MEIKNNQITRFSQVMIFVVMLFLLSCQDNNVTIKGDIDNLRSPYVITTYVSKDTLASDTIRAGGNGKFKYSADVDTLTTFTFYFNDYSSSAVVFADKKQKISIKGDAEMPDLMLVNGNEINNDLTAFKKENEGLLKQRAELFHNEKKDGEPSNDILSENESFAQINSLNHELTQKAESYIQENPSKPASVIIINDFFRNSENPQALDRVLTYLKEDALHFPLTTSLKTYSNDLKLSAEGSRLPYFMLIDSKNDTLRSNAFSGKYLLLSFVSAAGSESRDNSDVLKKEYAKLNRDSVKFISIYIDSDIYPITTIEEDSIPWITVPEKKSWAADIVDAYNIRYVPYNILISPNGIIRNRNIPAQEITKVIKSLTRKS